MEGNPSMAGVIALLQKAISSFHRRNVLSSSKRDGHQTLKNFYDTMEEIIRPFDAYYRGKSIFPVRSDKSTFISLVAFREHLLVETLVSAFNHAWRPDKLFVGVVVQNCFGREAANGTMDTIGKPCRSGPYRKGIQGTGTSYCTFGCPARQKWHRWILCTETIRSFLPSWAHSSFVYPRRQPRAINGTILCVKALGWRKLLHANWFSFTLCKRLGFKIHQGSEAH